MELITDSKKICELFVDTHLGMTDRKKFITDLQTLLKGYNKVKLDGEIIEAQNERTKHFAEKTGDKLFIEISITGNPDEAVNKIMRSISRGDEIFEGARVEQMLFKGANIDRVIDNKALEAIRKVKESIEEIYQLKNNEIR